jgi:DNA-binding XRE family transcriptional regulator
MSKEIYKIIRKMRIERDLSQLEIAKKLGVSRTSYIAIEQGKRELSLVEAQKIAAIFGITLDEIEKGLTPNYEKYKEMILAYLRHTGSVDGKLPKTKLAKLLYLADFGWFYDHMQSMSGMSYRKFQFGPVPNDYFRAIDELQAEGKIEVEYRDDMILVSENRGSRAQALQTLNKDEKTFIEEVAKRWKNKRTKEIVDFTHNQLPYKLCADDEVIPYELITQEDPDHVY